MSDNRKRKVAAIVLAAGSGRRMGADVTKQRMELLGKSVLCRTVEAFDNASEVDTITVVAKSDEIDFAKQAAMGASKPINFIIGGKTRAESAKIGFCSLDDSVEFVMIHDGARCLVTPDLINKVAAAAYIHGAATAASRVTDTLKRIDDNGMISATVARDGLMAVQTPQAFSRELYSRALGAVGTVDETITDDNMLVERIGNTVYPVISEDENIKITKMSDIAYAEFILRKRQEK